MQVETFECVETAAEPIEASEEAIALMEELGLDGQKELIAPVESKSSGSRCPYREITEEERFVYQTMCPKQIPLSRYNAAPIPLRVLQIAAHAQSLGMFKRLVVWDRETVTVKDPVLVAWTGGEYDWGASNRCFILARWGEELETFATLLKRSVVIARERLTNEAESLVKVVQALTDEQVVAGGAHKHIAWE